MAKKSKRVSNKTTSVTKTKEVGSTEIYKASIPIWQFVFGVLVSVAVLWVSLSKDDTSLQRNPVETRGKDSSCNLVMHASAFPSDNAGWGMFTLKSVKKGTPVSSGDVVIQIPDLMAEYHSELHLLLNNYVWGGTTSGGSYEGSVVYGSLPGTGHLANGNPTVFNMLPQNRPKMDNGGLSRDVNPGAGAISHYHDFSFYASQPLSPGDEIIVHYGAGYDNKVSMEHRDKHRRTVEELRETGFCLDNIRADQSTNKEAGRGAVATRFLEKGTIIAPAPLIPIGSHEALRTKRKITETVDSQTRQTTVESQQLLLNYCFGHRNSSLLLYPYSPAVHFINHDSKLANAKLRWSQSPLHFGKEWLTWPLDKVKSMRRTGLLLEFVATRDIQEGEEVLIDYGADWENAWKAHRANWTAQPLGKEYDYAFRLDKELDILNTEADLGASDYPDNIQMTCYYRYADHREEAASGSTTFQWSRTPQLLVTDNLRPCRLLNKEADSVGNIVYTAQMLNGHHTRRSDLIPEGTNHVVTRVPRWAIRLMDKAYSGDQHLPNAFRHEIGIPDEIFPRQWMDQS